MLCINSPVTNPYYQLAAEEFLLKNTEEDIFLLWKSDPVVVSGKHQNVLSEINYRYLKENGIKIARRLTGGGTVYHDHGNFNFSFIRNGEPGKMVDFTRFIEPVVAFLDSLGIHAEQGPKHEILVDGLKISGNAEHVYKQRTLHHGTLLFESNLDVLRKTILRKVGTYTDKAVQSNRARVTNISACLEGRMDANTFRDAFFTFILNRMQGTETSVSPQQNEAISLVEAQKYRTPEWIFGWSPDYAFSHSVSIGEVVYNIEVKTHRGRVNDVQLSSPLFSGSVVALIRNELTGELHTEEMVREVLRHAGLHRRLQENEFEDLVYSFF